jgi:hypothetical protein
MDLRHSDIHLLTLLWRCRRFSFFNVVVVFVGFVVDFFPMSVFQIFLLNFCTKSHSGLWERSQVPLSVFKPLIWTKIVTVNDIKVKKVFAKIADDFLNVYLGSAPKVFFSAISLYKAAFRLFSIVNKLVTE